MPEVPMRTIKFSVAYDGSAYSGWQYQPDRVTIQGEIETAIHSATRSVTRVTASGRTDAGVHAIGQVASCRIQSRLADRDLHRALNANLPFDIRIHSLDTVDDDFHAIRSATGKRYRYVVQDGGIRDVFSRKYCWYVPQRLDIEGMATAAKQLMGKHDFSSFETSGAPRKSAIRVVRHLDVSRKSSVNGQQVVFEVEADGFLYNMVRIIVGTLVQVGCHKKNVTWVGDVLAAKDRRAAGTTAPAQGLFLLRVFYN